MSCAEPLLRTRGASVAIGWQRVSAALLGRVGVGVLGLAALALWGWPLLGFLLGAVLPGLMHGDLRPSLQPLHDALGSGMLAALRNSLLVALAAAGLALPLGGWLAWLRVRSALAWRGWIEAGVWVLMVMPGYFLASGCMLLAAPIGPLASSPSALAAAQSLLGPLGIVLVMAFKALPFVFLALHASLEQAAAAPQEAARVLGLRPRQRLWLGVMLLLPALVAGFAAAFAESISDFAVAATLGAGSGFTLATYAIEQAVNAMPLNFPSAAASSWMLLSLIVPALLLQSGASRAGRSMRTLGPRHRPAPAVVLGARATALHLSGVMLIGMATLGMPVLAALSLAFGSGANDALAYQSVLGAFAYSLRLALVAASMTLVFAWPIANLVNQSGRAARVLDLVLLAVMVLPGIVLASAYVLVYNQPITPLYGGSTLLAMAYVALALPATVKVLQGPLAQLHQALVETAQVHGLSRWQALRAIELPLLAKPLFSAWLLAVLHIAFELPASELLYPAGSPPLAVALLDAAAGFQLQLQARLQLLGIGLLLAFATLAYLAFGRLRAGAVADSLNP